MNGHIEDLGIEGIAEPVRIGRGGNSVVYKARQTGLDRIVAVKVIRTDLDDTELRHFRREQRAVGRLSDIDGILTVFASGMTTNGDPYLVMPYLEAGSLADQIGKFGPVPWENAVPLMARVARAIHEAHQRGVFHGDLKPHNLLLDSNDHAQVVDFGIARLGDGTLSATSASFTPAYAPPELLESTNGPNVRSDVYGLGITLATLLDGRSPFGGKETSGSIALTISNVLTKEPELPVDCPSSLKAAVLRATAKDPAARPASALAFAEVLEAVTSGVAAASGGDGDQTRKVKQTARTAAPHVAVPGAEPGQPAPAQSNESGPARSSPQSPPRQPDESSSKRAWAWALLVLPLAALGAWLGASALGSDDGSDTEADADPLTEPEVHVTAVALGGNHTCALDSDSDVWCWGDNKARQLSHDGEESRLSPVRVDLGGERATDLTAGRLHTCALGDSGTAWCWGGNAFAQLDGRPPPPDSTTTFVQDPVRVEASVSFGSIDVGNTFTCALDTDGAAWCWGNNDGGRLGLGETGQRREGPVRVSGNRDYTQLAASGDGSCAIDEAGEVWCWGTLNASGEEAAVDNMEIELEPTLRDGLTDTVQIAAGEHHFCALDGDGTVRCWGRNSEGQLGNHSTESSLTPVGVLDLPPAEQIAADWFNTCALTKSRAVYCWGLNDKGQLATGESGRRRDLPVQVSTPSALSEAEWMPQVLGVGDGHVCAVEEDGWTWCWGANPSGQLGVGDAVQRAIPTLVTFEA